MPNSDRNNPQSTEAAGAQRGRTLRLLIVDDSLVFRHLIVTALRQEPDIEIIGTEADGEAALRAMELNTPDVVTLDVDMPGMNGLETLREIRKRFPQVRTVLFSKLASHGAPTTLEALSIGADDYAEKVSNAGKLDLSLELLRSELIPKLRQFFDPHPVTNAVTNTAAIAPPHLATPHTSTRISAPLQRSKIQVVAIGVSTGGPMALASILPKLPADLPVPIVIVQHMPVMFTGLLAHRLDESCPLHIVEAEDGMELKAGTVIIAKGGLHMKVKRTGIRNVIEFSDEAPVGSCKPSVDVLFKSLAKVYGASVLPIILTGMGYDGLDGVKTLKHYDTYCIVQDKQTSSVWGMPGAIVREGMADEVLPLEEIPAAIERLVKG